MSNELDSKIGQVLKDLYQIDPAFKQHELRIKEIIKEVLLAKPDTKFDEAFAVSLKRKLMAQADLIKEHQGRSLLASLKNIKRLNYALGFVAIAALITAGGLYVSDQKSPATPADNNIAELFASAPKVNRLGNSAFGKLASSAAAGTPVGMGGGGGASATDNATAKSMPAIGLGGGGGYGFIPPLISYKYVYKGGDFNIEPSQMTVYRRIKTPTSGADISSLLKKMNFGLVNMNSFSNLTLQNMNFAEDKDFGYMFYVSLQEGTISASENWQRWPTPDKQCRDQACFDSLRLQMSDIPDDQTLIGITNQFLDDHGIARDNYDSPYVESSWKIDYANAADKANSYIPNILSVVYPQKVDGHVIYDGSGNKTGLYVSVDLQAKKASGFNELYAQNYDSSNYDVETDASKVISMAEKGGMNGYYFNGSEGQVKQIELGTPTLVYVKTYNYSQNVGQSEELLVPALIFPITKAPGDQPFYQKNVVVPLPKDLLQQDSNGPIRIMPAPAQ